MKPKFEIKTNEDVELMDKAIDLSAGNIGVLTVLDGILCEKPEFIHPLRVSMLLTKSSPELIWIVYKDICKEDIHEAIDYLKKWCYEKSISLNEYVKINNPEARHYDE